MTDQARSTNEAEEFQRISSALIEMRDSLVELSLTLKDSLFEAQLLMQSESTRESSVDLLSMPVAEIIKLASVKQQLASNPTDIE